MGMADCTKCIHEKACQAWINHGNILYDDFEYSTEGCLNFVPTVVRCKDCKNYFHSKETVGWRCKLDGQVWNKDDFCSYGERR